MPIFRLLLAWLVLAALPLQGFAAASMLLCGQASAPVAAVHEHHAHHGHEAHGHMAAGDDHGKVKHSCGVCAFCGHVIGLTDTHVRIVAADAPPADLPQPEARLATRASPRPDKPPRA